MMESGEANGRLSEGLSVEGSSLRTGLLWWWHGS